MLNLEIFQTDNSEKLSDFVKEVDNVNYIASGIKSPEILKDSPPLISIAAFFGARECFQMLLFGEASLEISDRQGRLPIHFASAGGSIEICDCLDSAGVDFTLFDNQHYNCLHYACKFNHFSIVERLFFRNFSLITAAFDSLTPLHLACLSNDPQIVDFLCSKGVDINCKTSDQRTPLLIALKNGSHEILKILVKYGVNTQIIESDGMTPLMLACRRGNREISEILLENKNLDPNCADSLGWTALHFAAEKDDVEIVKLLISKNADINLKTKAGMTPTHLAANRQCANVLATLKENGGAM